MKRTGRATPADFRSTCTRAEADRIDARFWAKVKQEGDCWVWTGSVVGHGYGRFALTSSVLFVAHRWAWEDRHGPVPDGLQLDHLCRVPRCVNPDHLEPVTGQVNMARAVDAAQVRTHCDRGHELTEQNIRRNPKGWLLCKTCINTRTRQLRREQRKSRTEEERAQETARNQADYRRVRPPLAADDPRHGTDTGYIRWWCRCERCVEAHRDAGRAFRARRQAAT